MPAGTEELTLTKGGRLVCCWVIVGAGVGVTAAVADVVKFFWDCDVCGIVCTDICGATVIVLVMLCVFAIVVVTVVKFLTLFDVDAV